MDQMPGTQQRDGSEAEEELRQRDADSVSLSGKDESEAAEKIKSQAVLTDAAASLLATMQRMPGSSQWHSEHADQNLTTQAEPDEKPVGEQSDSPPTSETTQLKDPAEDATGYTPRPESTNLMSIESLEAAFGSIETDVSYLDEEDPYAAITSSSDAPPPSPLPNGGPGDSTTGDPQPEPQKMPESLPDEQGTSLKEVTGIFATASGIFQRFFLQRTQSILTLR
jgi:hypothetical protein